MPRINRGETLDVRGTIALENAEAILIRTDALSRSVVARNDETPYTVPMTSLRVHDNLSSLLPASASSDDLGLIDGTFGTDSAKLQTSDAKATTVTQRARFLFTLPAEYITGETIIVRCAAGMDTTVSDGTATLDVECYQSDDDGGVGSDLCATSAQSINSLTIANKDFSITPTGLAAGDTLDIRLTIAITDSSTGTVVLGEIAQIAMILDIRG